MSEALQSAVAPEAPAAAPPPPPTKPDTTIEKEKQKSSAAYYIWTLVGLAFMIFFRFIPAPDPITEVGMAMLGFFIGMIVLWSVVDLVWPTFVGICIFSLDAVGDGGVYPIPSNSTQGVGIYEAGVQSFGNWITIFVLGTLIICYALNSVGTIRRITMYFITRKFAKKSAWTFTFMLLLSGLVIALFLDVTAAQIFMIMIAHEIFEELGYKKGDAWPRFIIIGITFTAIIGFTMTPICHTLPILFTGISSAISGVPVNLLSYMLAAIPVGFVIWIIMFFWFKLVVKPDVSKFDAVDYNVFDSKRPGPMQKKEKIVVVVCVLIVICWIVPGFAAFLSPDAQFTAIANALSATFPLYAGIGLLGIIRIDGKSVLDIKEAFQKIEWMPIILLAGIMMVASAMGEDSTGIPAWIMENVIPLVQGLSPFLFIGVICVIGTFLTNIANNVPVGIILVTVGTTASMNMGLNPAILAVAVCIATNLAFTIPPAYVPIGFAYSDPWCRGSSVFKNGAAMMVISMIVCFLLVYPLGALFFGAAA